MGINERRQFPRVDIGIGVSWVKVIPEDYAVYKDYVNVTKNISEGGLCMIGCRQLEEGELLTLNIELPSGKIVKATGEVVWSKGFDVPSERGKQRFDIGVKFTDISPEDKEEIKKMVASYNQNPPVGEDRPIPPV
ncbi:MAG: PilZ domain-containing protein [Candidatus Omnitrophota bacterium]